MIRTTMGCGFIVAIAALSPFARAQVVYQNVNPDWTFIQPIAPGEEIGDDVILAGTARYVTGFSVPISNTYATPFAATFTAHFYAPTQDGLPGAQLWQGALNLIDLQPGADTTLNFPAPNVTVPDSFIWSLAVTTTPPASDPANEVIGTINNDVPQVGSSNDVFFYNAGDGSGWGSFDYKPDPDLANFQATITASSVPEPAACSVLALGAIAGLLRRRRHA